MDLREKLERYARILAFHEWQGSIKGYCCLCDFCKKGRALSRRWVELTRKEPILTLLA